MIYHNEKGESYHNGAPIFAFAKGKMVAIGFQIEIYKSTKTCFAQIIGPRIKEYLSRHMTIIEKKSVMVFDM
jgi:hypothetical protein